MELLFDVSRVQLDEMIQYSLRKKILVWTLWVVSVKKKLRVVTSGIMIIIWINKN